MTMAESTRLMLGLRAAGWSDTEIVDFVVWVETGNEQYKPKAAEKKEKADDKQ